MSSLSGKNLQLFEEFKKEAKIVELTSQNTKKKKKAIKWNGRIFSTTSYRQVFDIVKPQLLMKN